MGQSLRQDDLKIALVCDWLTTPGGAEKVLLELHRMYPDAPIYTSQYSKKGIDWFNDAEVHTGWLQIFPAGLRKILGPLRQLYFSHLDLSSYDVVISVTGAEAKSVRTEPKKSTTSQGDEKRTCSTGTSSKAFHLCYCHVPTQYYWQMYDQYVANPGFGVLNPLIRLCFKLFVKPLRKADYRAAQRPDQFVTISEYAKQQIQQYYDREAVIIAPPVEVDKFRPRVNKTSKSEELSTAVVADIHKISTGFPQEDSDLSTEKDDFSTEISKKSTETKEKSTSYPQVIHKKSETFPQQDLEFSTSNDRKQGKRQPQILMPPVHNYYIIACRQVTWKRVDLAIQACLKAKVPLLVVGDGSEHQRLVELADNSPLIKFLPWASTEELAGYLQNAKAYIFPSLEPFGVAAVEALAAGCPVIAYAQGGSRDFIRNQQNGVLFQEQSVKAIVKAIREFEQLKFNRAKVSESADKFAVPHFRTKIEEIVKRNLNRRGTKHE